MASPPPPSGLSKKPHFPFPKPSSNFQQISSKSHSNSICKTLIILVLLLFIPLFPSQAPDFITQTIFTEFWEIIHLLFIGIAVSYGVFGRKSPQMVPGKIESSRNDDSHAYLSGISHLSSIFEDGFDNICGPDDEHDIMQNYYANYCQCFQKSGDQFLGKDRCVVHGGITKTRSSVSNNGSEINFCNSNGKNVNQTWSSQYLKGESLVVVSNGKHFLGESSDFKPLNLPVRSLRSNNKPELQNRCKSSPNIEAKGNGDVKVPINRGLIPMNLEKKFDESAGPSSIPWRSRSWRMENGDDLNNLKPPSHYRPHSVGDFEFEHLKSRSLQGSKFSSSPELARSKVEIAEGEMVFSVSHPKTSPSNGARTWIFSNGNNCEEDKAGKGKQPIESLDSDAKSSSLANVLSRAKSVRTIKSSRHIMNQKEQCEDFEEEPENPPVNHLNREFDRHFSMPKPKPTVPEFLDEDKEDIVYQNDTVSEEESEEDRASEFEKNSDEDDAKTNVHDDAELEGSEVDRKAGEFIAKFREQIRLQKTSSIKGYSGW
ncbi:hypothetical protein DH2020_046962 [Rehmannia glutinosa]|uniref:Uncharacterized protein n=1 Tax=Rehmannia glutinosa TaxID=99300 RepID=A0ABR0UAG0_REHGL